MNQKKKRKKRWITFSLENDSTHQSLLSFSNFFSLNKQKEWENRFVVCVHRVSVFLPSIFFLFSAPTKPITVNRGVIQVSGFLILFPEKSPLHNQVFLYQLVQPHLSNFTTLIVSSDSVIDVVFYKAILDVLTYLSLYSIPTIQLIDDQLHWANEMGSEKHSNSLLEAYIKRI